MAAQLPLIGIAVSPPEDGSHNYNLNPEYSEAIRRAGGAPLAFALIPDDDYVERVMPLVHGLLLTGSQYDLDPAWYGAQPESGTLDPNYDRDNFDRLILDWAGEHSLPVLGICHGCQAINVALGGTLIQDIPAEVSHALNHRTPSNTGEFAHEIELAPGSLLNPGGETLVTRVNSAHHQAVGRVAPALKPIAWSADGVIEALEAADLERQFILAVQWHPERLAADDPLSAKVIEVLVAAARRWMAKDSHPEIVN
ncbi:MAG: gamma-glutamyl-gamma-aminobutyrate hydrolase family protein [Candidatus Marinimicrobia bacterium]|nr:gamma-glutamyl-gamma-aminobutyrate hydrolase family protein [Candidatus Neomarinimicrobiota bacterium]